MIRGLCSLRFLAAGLLLAAASVAGSAMAAVPVCAATAAFLKAGTAPVSRADVLDIGGRSGG